MSLSWAARVPESDPAISGQAPDQVPDAHRVATSAWAAGAKALNEVLDERTPSRQLEVLWIAATLSKA